MEQKKVNELVDRIQRSKSEFEALTSEEKERRARLAMEIMEEVISKFLIMNRCFDGEEEEALHWIFTRLMCRAAGKDPRKIEDMEALVREFDGVGEMRDQVRKSLKRNVN